MPDHAMTRLRSVPTLLYSDTTALNDIHTILTTPDPGLSVLADIAEIVARTGRPLVAARDIEISTTETALGWPVACTQAGDATIYVRQEPAGSGLRVEITTKTDAEAGVLIVTLDGTTLHPSTQPDPKSA
jgi:hypothetical protein